jgi:Ser/Thr protein kinase RdoA (MazF antagonist)
MLSLADADIVRRDPAIAGLANALDCERFTVMLQRCFPDTNITCANITYLRYRPGTDCLAGYQVSVAGKETAVYVATYGPNARDKLANSRRFDADSGPLGSGRVILEDCATALYVFPNDQEIEGLRRLWEPQSRQHLLLKASCSDPRFVATTAHILRYKPERRFVARLNDAGQAVAVLKVYAESGFGQALINAKAFESHRGLKIARLLGYSTRARALVFEWLPGRPLFDLDSDNRRALSDVERIGAALAEFHAQPAASVALLTSTIEAQSLKATAQVMGFTLPRLASRVDSLACHLCECLVNEPAESHPIHGDFYDKQVLLNDDGVAVLDLDKAVRGHRAVDLANFLAHLHRDVAYGILTEDQVESFQEALLEGYRATRSIRKSVEVYTAIGLLRLAPHPFRERLTDWPERTTDLVERSAAISGTADRFFRPAAADSPSTISVADPFGAAEDASMPFLPDALDHREVRRRLGNVTRLFAVKEHLQVRGIRVTRYKPGRRCLIEYDVELQRAHQPCEAVTLIGKVRAKGTDKRTYRVVTELWRAGLRDDADNDVCVPEPIGVVPEFNLWLQRKAPGVIATRLIAEKDGTDLARRIAEAIHQVHQITIPTRRRHTITDELHILHECLPRVARENPYWTERIDRILAACDRVAIVTPEPKYCGIHRDFYADQVLVNGPRLYLLDFDLYCEGDPGLDIGNFRGHMIEQGLRTLGCSDSFADRDHALVERFVNLTGEAVRASVSTYTTLTLARHIYISTLFRERRPFTESLIELCEHRLGVAGSTCPEGSVHT